LQIRRRIELPWGDIARMTHEVSHGLALDHDPTVAVPHETGATASSGENPDVLHLPAARMTTLGDLTAWLGM
jgi:hypothetical protein